MNIERVIIDIVDLSPGVSSSAIASCLDRMVQEKWERRGGLLRWLSKYRLVRWYYLDIRNDFWPVLHRLADSGRLRREKGEAAYRDGAEVLHRYRYYPASA